jgi:hypothetical protein
MSSSEYLYDLQTFVDSNHRYGDEKTFTGFEPGKNENEQGRIGFIWLGPKDGACGGIAENSDFLDERVKTGKARTWSVAGYAVLPNVFDDGVYLSDHRCVVGDMHGWGFAAFQD